MEPTWRATDYQIDLRTSPAEGTRFDLPAALELLRAFPIIIDE